MILGFRLRSCALLQTSFFGQKRAFKGNLHFSENCPSSAADGLKLSDTTFSLEVKLRAVLFLSFYLFSALTFATEAGRPYGTNCNLSTPPTNAGEEFNHGITLRIFPRARDINSKYTGCQTMWAPDGKEWSVVAIAAIEAGDPVRLWSPVNSGSAKFNCVYKKGKVVKGDEEHCAHPQFLIAKSLAPGCVAQIRKSVASDGLSAPTPSGCNYE